jgi:hypothetical protein
VLADLDSSLGAWLAAALPARTEIDFGSPDDLPDASRRRPLVNLFLHAVEEDTSGLAAADVRLRDADGRVRSALLPTRRYAVTYLVTAWAGDAAEEHRLLGAVLAAHAGRDTLDGECLRGALRMVDAHIPIAIGAGGAPAAPERLGAARHAGLALTVVVPVFPQPVAETAPPAENLDLIAATKPSVPTPVPSAGPARRWRRTSRTEQP